VVEGRSFDLGTIREIKNRLEGATVNDVVLSICGGALRRYLQAKGELPEEPLVAMAPISVRDEGEKGSAGNRVSAMAVALGTNVADPLERLHRVHEGAVQSKALTNAIGARLMTDYGQFIPSATAGLAARLYSRMALANRLRPVFNTVVTNIPGPQVPLYAYGARLVTQFGLGPILDGMGLIHPVVSYCGQITIAVTSCREMMPDPSFYAHCLQDSFDELRDAPLQAGAGCDGQWKVPRAARRRRRAPTRARPEGLGRAPCHQVAAERPDRTRDMFPGEGLLRDDRPPPLLASEEVRGASARASDKPASTTTGGCTSPLKATLACSERSRPHPK
jgi:hypothetical protein